METHKKMLVLNPLSKENEMMSVKIDTLESLIKLHQEVLEKLAELLFSFQKEGKENENTRTTS